MLQFVLIEDYRSLKNIDLDLTRINLLTGENNSGKSSVLYALYTLQNAYTLHSRVDKVDALLRIGKRNLGDFEQLIHFDNPDYFIQVIVGTSSPYTSYSGCLFDKEELTFLLSDNGNTDDDHEIDIPLPYNGTKNILVKNHPTKRDWSVYWNGILAYMGDDTIVEGNKEERQLVEVINGLQQTIANATFIVEQTEVLSAVLSPPVTPQRGGGYLDIEHLLLALRDDDKLTAIVSEKVEQYLQKTLIAKPMAGTQSFRIQLRDHKIRSKITDLANEGSGVQHFIALLTAMYQKHSNLVCIDEPKIHMHPQFLSYLADEMAAVASSGADKQFIIVTHSEHFIMALLNRVRAKQLSPDNLNVFHCTMEDGKTKIEQQEINAEGQIAGGLKVFLQAQLNELDILLGKD